MQRFVQLHAQRARRVIMRGARRVPWFIAIAMLVVRVPRLALVLPAVQRLERPGAAEHKTRHQQECDQAPGHAKWSRRFYPERGRRVQSGTLSCPHTRESA